MALFRQEAVLARDMKFAAESALTYPVTLPRLLAAGGAALAAATLLACCVRYTEYANAPGMVRMGVGERVAVSGQRGIVHLPAAMTPGRELQAHELIATVQVAPSATAVNALAPQAEAVLATKKRSLADEIAVNDEAEHAFSAVTGEQLRNLGVQRDALRAQLELLGARDKLQQAQVQRSAELLKGGYVTAEYDAKTRSDEFTLQIQQNEVRQKIADVEQQMLNARQDRTDKVNQMRAGRLRAAQDIAEIDSRLQSAAGNRSVDVRAAEPGRLAALHVNDGDFVTEDTPLATLEQASGGTEIVCFADAQAVADLRVGAPVKVSFPAFPYLIHGVADATVVEIDSAPWLGDAAQGAGAPLKAAANPRYRVVARIDSPERLARARIRAVAGMAAVVQIPHATRTLFQWLFLTAGPNDR